MLNPNVALKSITPILIGLFFSLGCGAAPVQCPAGGRHVVSCEPANGSQFGILICEYAPSQGEEPYRWYAYDKATGVLSETANNTVQNVSRVGSTWTLFRNSYVQNEKAEYILKFDSSVSGANGSVSIRSEGRAITNSAVSCR